MSAPPLTDRLRPARRQGRLPGPAAVYAAEHAAGHTLDDPHFPARLAALDGNAPLHAGSRPQLHVDGAGTLAAMLAAVAEARREVLVEFYILRDDTSGQRLADALVDARHRGVRVHVLADALGSLSTAASYWQRLRTAGVDVRLFHRLRLPWGPQFLRDHRKILVVDRHLAFVGGMNVCDESMAPRERRPDVWRDTQVRVEGTVAVELAAVFAEGWKRAGGGVMRAWEEGSPADPAAAAAAPRVLVQDARPLRGQREMAAVLAAILAASRRRVWITNAYFAPSARGLRALAATAHRGVDVRLLLAGPTDLPLLRHAGHDVYDSLLAAGVRIFEYQPTVLHAKTLVADDHLALIGSTNLDLRSFRFNGECNLVFWDRPLARRLAAIFRCDLRRAVAIDAATWARRPRLHRCTDRLAGLLRPLL